MEREPPRFPVQCPIKFSGDLVDEEGTLVNLSKDGGAVATNQQVSKGSYMFLRLHLPDRAPPMKVELAVVRWVIGDVFGLEFIRIQPEEQRRLHKFVRLLEMTPPS